MRYLITHFFDKWGYKLNGNIDWQGEDINDRGRLQVVDSKASVVKSEYGLFI